MAIPVAALHNFILTFLPHPSCPPRLKLSVLTLVQPTREHPQSLHDIQSTHTHPHLSSCVGVWQNDRVEIIANDQGNRTTPSYVSFSDNERLIGDAAKNQVAMNPHNTYVIHPHCFPACPHPTPAVFSMQNASLDASLMTRRSNRISSISHSRFSARAASPTSALNTVVRRKNSYVPLSSLTLRIQFNNFLISSLRRKYLQWFSSR